MDVNTTTTMIQTVGFPIACVIGLAWFIFKSYNTLQTQNKEREEKLYTIISDCQTQMAQLGDTNTRFVEVLQTMQNDVNLVKEDIDDIKDYLALNKRASDKER